MNELIDNKSAEWKGYTLEELRMRRTLVRARLEIEKYKLGQSTKQFREAHRLADRTLFGRIMGLFSYAEYAILAFRLAQRAVRLFRHK